MRVYIKNLGGLIGEHTFELKEGINEVRAPNASGKTSFIKSLLALLDPGNPDVRPENILNLDASEGYVRISIDGEEYFRVFKREGGRILEAASKLLANDERFSWLLLDPFMGKLVPKILAGEDDVTDFIDLVLGLSKLRRELDELKRKEGELEVRRRDLLEKNRDLVRYLQERDEIEQKLKEKESKLQRLETEVVRVKEEVERSIRDLREEIGRLEGRYNSYVEELKETDERIEDLLSRISAYEKRVEEFYRKYPEPEKILDSIDKDIEDVRKTIREHEERLASINRVGLLLREVSRERPSYCPLCERPIEEPEAFWDQRIGKLSESEKKIRESIDKLKDREIALLNRKGEIEGVYAEIRNIEGVELPSLKRRLELEKEKKEKLKKEIEEIMNKVRIYNERIAELESRMPEEERKRIEEQARLAGEVKALREYIEGIGRRIVALGDVGHELEEVEKELANTKRNYSELVNKLYDLRRGIVLEFRKIANEVVRAIGFTWFKSVSLDEHEGRYLVRVVRALPSGREERQSLRQLSTSERISIAVILVLTGYRLGIVKEYPPEKVLIMADEAMLAFDPERYEKTLKELKEYGKYIIVTKLAEPAKEPTLTIEHR
ncbi:MAG: hypothetical protein QW290_08035 [Sulfolobales archaeon]